MNQVSFLLSMRFMLLRYSFEFRPNNHALGTEGSVTVSSSVYQKKDANTKQNQFDKR